MVALKGKHVAVAENKEGDLNKDSFKSPEVRSGLLPAFNTSLPSHLPTPHSPSNYITRPPESPSSPTLENIMDNSRYFYMSGPSSAHLPQRPHYSSTAKHARPIFPSESELAGPSRMSDVLNRPNASQVATPSPEFHPTRLPVPTSLRTPHAERTEKYQGSRPFDATSPATSTIYHSSPEYRAPYDDSDDPFIADPSPRQCPAHQPRGEALLLGHVIKGKNALDGSIAKLVKSPGAFSGVKMEAEGDEDAEGEDDAEGEADDDVDVGDHTPLRRSRTPVSSPLQPPRTPIQQHHHHHHAHTATTTTMSSADEPSAPFLATAFSVQTPLALPNAFSQSNAPSAFPRGSAPSPDLFNPTAAGFARTPTGGELGPRLPSASPFRPSSSPSRATDNLLKTPPPRPRGARSASPTCVKRHKDADANNVLLRTSPPSTPPPLRLVTAAAPPRTPSPPAGGEIARLRRERAALAEARLTASEPRRPEYLVRVVKRPRGEGGGGEEEEEEREREMGEREGAVLGVTMSPSRGRRLKLYHPVPVVADAKMKRQAQSVLWGSGGGSTTEPVAEALITTTPPLLPRMDLRAIDWRTPRDAAVSSSAVLLPAAPASLPRTTTSPPTTSADGGPAIWVWNLEEAEKRRKRLDAFRATKPTQRGKSLRVVEAEGRGRILVDPTKPDLYGLVKWGILPELPTLNDPAAASSSSASSSVPPCSAHLLPQWPDAHFPWSLDAQQRKKAEEAERAMRLEWIGRFLDRESSSEEEEEEEVVILEGESGGEEEQGGPSSGRKRGGRGKRVVLRAELASPAAVGVSAPVPLPPPARSTKKSKPKSKAKPPNTSASRSLSSASRIHPGTVGPRHHRRRMLFKAPASNALQVFLSKKQVRRVAFRAYLRRLAEEEEGVVRCICQTGDDGRGMVRCDACRGWYHLVCMDIGDEDELGEKWFCFRCVEGGKEGERSEEKMTAGQKTRIPTFAPDRPLSPPRSDIGDQPLYQPLLPRPGALQPSPIPVSPTRTPHGGLFSTDEGYAPFDPTSTPSRGLRFPVPPVTPRTSRVGSGWAMRAGPRYARVLEEAWGDESPVRRSSRTEEEEGLGLEESPRLSFESRASPLLNGPFMFESPVRRAGTGGRDSPLAGRGGARWETGC